MEVVGAEHGTMPAVTTTQDTRAARLDCCHLTLLLSVGVRRTGNSLLASKQNSTACPGGRGRAGAAQQGPGPLSRMSTTPRSSKATEQESLQLPAPASPHASDQNLPPRGKDTGCTFPRTREQRLLPHSLWVPLPRDAWWQNPHQVPKARVPCSLVNCAVSLDTEDKKPLSLFPEHPVSLSLPHCRGSVGTERDTPAGRRDLARGRHRPAGPHPLRGLEHHQGFARRTCHCCHQERPPATGDRGHWGPLVDSTSAGAKVKGMQLP